MEYRTVAEVEKALQKNIAVWSEKHSKNFTTDRTRRLAEHVGSPHLRAGVVHVAGTSGKTSTSYFVAGLLRASGVSVGLTVSPHIDSLAERVQINGAPLDEATFCVYFSEFSQLVESFGETPSYFEFLLVFALWVFQREDVQYVVLETGLGGLYDSTNICRGADKVCTITDIGFDHVTILGSTLAEIATQKAGIIAPRNEVFMYRQSDEVMQSIETCVADQRAHLTIVTSPDQNDIPLKQAPLYQQHNWWLAYRTYRYIVERDGLPTLTKQELTQTLEVHVPGRMDVFKLGDKTVVLDGAHNPQKLETFFTSFVAQYPNCRPKTLLALKQGKDSHEAVRVVAAHCDNVTVTTFTKEQDMPSGAHDPTSIAKELRVAGVETIHVEKHLQKALGNFLDEVQEIGIVTGSFYLVAEVRRLLARYVV